MYDESKEDLIDRVKGLSKSLLQWYKFKKNGKVLYIDEQMSGEAPILKIWREKGMTVDYITLDELSYIENRHTGSYDYIVIVKALEKTATPIELLEKIGSLLLPAGTLLLGVNNRLGIRYFCGDRDPYTGRNFDGMENYRRTYQRKEDQFAGRMYSKAEWTHMLQKAGFDTFQFYSVFTDLDNPSLIFAEDYLPNEDLANRVFPTYNYPDSVFLEEESLYASLLENGMFHSMANAYLIECPKDGELSDVNHVTASLERGREDALFTIIHKSGIVEKRAAYPEGLCRLEQLIANGEDLKQHGISVVDAVLDGESYVMPYIEAEVGQVYLKRLIQQDKEAFLQAMDHFRDLILQSSEIISLDCGDGNGAMLKKAYLDMVPLNSFYKDGEFMFYDQEFCVENYPANVVIYRMIASFYSGNTELGKIVSMREMLERYGLVLKLEHWQALEWKFLGELWKEKELRLYHEKYRRNPEVVNANRQRMNYSEEEYQRKFVDIFRNLGDRKLILFGSGAFTKRFIAMYGKSYEIACILDNNEDRLGQRLDGYEIKSPEYLKELSKEDYKVLICIKSYVSVAKQLESMGITDYGIFDTSRSYAKPVYRQEGIDTRTDLSVKAAQSQQSQESGTETKKKYHIGYVAGVFDMFHTGHVRLLQRAKELCDYLIVGVVSDEDCYRQKNKYPVISCEDRVEVIKACRYADQVEALPTGFGGIRDAYKMFQFDVQFSGDDHGEDGGWLAEKEYLNKHGADLVFFDYTKGISSTEIRKKLER